MKQQRKFDGHHFSLAFNRNTKADAIGMKKHIHFNGGQARVVKSKEGYGIYARYSTAGKLYGGKKLSPREKWQLKENEKWANRGK
jgi:hypothetical protein